MYVIHINQILHVFICDDIMLLCRYAGGSSIFGNGKMCKKCSEIKKPFDLYIEITKQLDAKDLYYDDAYIRGVGIEMSKSYVGSMPYVQLNNIPGLPIPEIVGPLLNKGTRLRKRENDKQNNKGVQRWLKKYGWYDGEIDGIFDLVESSASKAMEHFKKTYFNLGDNINGIAGQAVRDFMLEKRDGNIDPHGLNLWRDEYTYPLQSKEFRKMLYDQMESNGIITYCITSLPGILFKNIDATYNEIQQAFDEWSNILVENIKFTKVDILNKETSNILITFTDQSDDNILYLDDIGGNVGRSGLINDRIQIDLDITETWGLMTTTLTPIQRKLNRKLIKLYPVMRHMIGHLLGLDNDDRRNTIMSPWYADWSANIGEHERERLVNIGWTALPQSQSGTLNAMQTIRTFDENGEPILNPEQPGLDLLPSANDAVANEANAMGPALQDEQKGTCC